MEKEKTPDQLLAEKIAADIRAKKLLSSKQLDDLPGKLVSSSMRKEDWQLLIEMALDAEKPRKDARKD